MDRAARAGWRVSACAALAVLAMACDDKKVPLEPASGPGDTSTAPAAASRSEHPEDYKLFLAPDVSDETVLAELSASALHAKVSLSLEDGEPKCRSVAFLDAGAVFRERGLSLRLRRQLNGDCQKQNERLAISFNHSVATRDAAVALRDEMTLADGLADRNVKDRYKLRHVLGSGGATDVWVVGGTVRRLAGIPNAVADVLAMFPRLTGLEAERAQKLTPVAGRWMFEKNHDIGLVKLAASSARIELATIHADDAGAPGNPLARELSIELEACCDAAASLFAHEVARRLAGKLLPIAARDDLVYER